MPLLIKKYIKPVFNSIAKANLPILLDKVGGTAKLAQLLNRICALNIDRYADLVMDKFHRRRVIEE